LRCAKLRPVRGWRASPRVGLSEAGTHRFVGRRRILIPTNGWAARTEAMASVGPNAGEFASFSECGSKVRFRNGNAHLAHSGLNAARFDQVS